MKLKLLMFMLALFVSVDGCGPNEYVNPDITQPPTDASRDASGEEAHMGCSVVPTVYPDWNEQAVLTSNATDFVGNAHQEVTVMATSPVMLDVGGGHTPQLVVDSSVQRTMRMYGTTTGLIRLVTKDQNRCGYVYEVHIGFSTLGCELRTCRSIRVGDRFRFQLNACSDATNQCLTGVQSQLTVVPQQ